MNRKFKTFIVASSIVALMPLTAFAECTGGCSGINSIAKLQTQTPQNEKSQGVGANQDTLSFTEEQKKAVVEEMMKVIQAERQAIETLYKNGILTEAQRDRRLEMLSKKEANIKENGFPRFTRGKHKAMDR